MTRSTWSLGVVAALLLAASPALAQLPFPLPPPLPPVDATARFDGGVVMHGDVVFATRRGYRPNTLDLYLPPKTARPLPLVVFVHGGGWAGSDARGSEIVGRDFPKMFAQLAGKGYAVASVNYRLSSEAKFPAPVQDVNAAIRFLRGKSAAYGIDPGKLVLWGASAGSQIAMVTALDCNDHSLDPSTKATDPSTCPNAVIDYFGPTSVIDKDKQALWATYLGCAEAACPENWRKVQAVNLLSAKAPPFLIVHGDADTLVPVEQSRDLAARLSALNVKAELRIVANANHLFYGALAADTEALVARTFAFIGEQTR